MEAFFAFICLTCHSHLKIHSLDGSILSYYVNANDLRCNAMFELLNFSRWVQITDTCIHFFYARHSKKEIKYNSWTSFSSMNLLSTKELCVMHWAVDWKLLVRRGCMMDCINGNEYTIWMRWRCKIGWGPTVAMPRKIRKKGIHKNINRAKAFFSWLLVFFFIRRLDNYSMQLDSAPLRSTVFFHHSSAADVFHVIIQ